jgi:hypothetical protein
MTEQRKPLRRTGRIWLFVISVTLLPFLLLFLLTRSFLLAPIVASMIAGKIEGNVVIEEAKWDWSGKITLEGVSLHSKTISDPTSKLLFTPLVEVTFDSFFPTVHSVASILTESITVRVAESTQNSGEFNFTTWAFLAGDGKKTASSDEVSGLSLDSIHVPQIEIGTIILESGTMQDGVWKQKAQKEFSVEVRSSNEEELNIDLVDVQEPLSVSISVAENTFQLSMDDVSLDSSIFAFLPRRARAWCEETDLHGGVKSLGVQWNAQDGLIIEADIEQVQFSLPEEHGVRWAHYDKGAISRMHGSAKLDVRKGTIVYDGESVSLKDIEGVLSPPTSRQDAPVTFRADLHIFELPNFGEQDGSMWMETMLLKSPFNAQFYISDFHASANGEAYLPVAAAEILKLFQLKKWNIASKVSVQREVFGAATTVRGELIIDGASGKYQGFPYPLHEITSSITFHDNEIEIVYLNAKGSNDSKVHISGIVDASPDYLMVELNLHAPSASLDAALQDALPIGLQNVMGRLFNSAAYTKIEHALQNSYGSTYKFGGVIGLDLDILHDSRLSQDVTVQGEVSFEDVGILYDGFPFPVTLQRGMVIVNTEGVFIPDGEVILFEGAGGGNGEVRGSIDFLPDGSSSPNLQFNLANEWVTPALLKAVSYASGESHDLALGVLTGLGIESRLTAVGNIIGNKEGGIDTDFLVGISEGEAVLNRHFSDAIHAAGPFWPEGFLLEGINAKIKIKNGVITMDGATCECGIGSVEVFMEIDGDSFDLVLRGSELPISPQFVNVLPETASRTLPDAWNRLHPTGLMDATIRMSSSGNIHELNLEIIPNTIVISDNETSMTLERSSGSLIVENTDVFLNDLVFLLEEDAVQMGQLEIAGTVHGTKEAFKLDINADWIDASIGSPLSRAITGIVGGDAVLDYYDALNPSGTAEASLRAQGGFESVVYNIDIIPSELSATFQDRRAVAVFSKDKKDKIHFDTNGIHFQNIQGKLGEGNFTLDGIVDTVSSIDGVFQLTWEGPADDKSLFAVLPSVVGDTLEAIDIADGVSTLPKGVVTLSGKNWSELAVGFAGDIYLDDVSVEVGVPLKEIDGVIRVDGTYDQKNLSELALSLDIEDMVVLGRPIQFVTGQLLLDPQAKRLVFENMGGESTTGGVAVQGWIAVDDSKEFEIEVSISEANIAAEDGDDALASLEGKLTGWLSIAGVRGDVGSKRGVGEVTVREGKLKVDPLSNTAMHLLQLALPTANTITGAKIQLYLVGDKIVLDGITLTSSDSEHANLVLSGEGTIDIKTFEIQARLNPRVGLPIIRDIVGALSDNFYAIDVTGELFNPKVSVMPLPFLSPQ